MAKTLTHQEKKFFAKAITPIAGSDAIKEISNVRKELNLPALEIDYGPLARDLYDAGYSLPEVRRIAKGKKEQFVSQLHGLGTASWIASKAASYSPAAWLHNPYRGVGDLSPEQVHDAISESLKPNRRSDEANAAARRQMDILLESREKELEAGERTGFSDVMRRWLEDPTAVSVPFYSDATRGFDLLMVWESAKRLELGLADDVDKLIVLQYYDEITEDKTMGGIAATVMTEAPKYLGEFVATWGAYTAGATAARATTMAGARKILGKSVANQVRRSLTGKAVGQGVAGFAAQGAKGLVAKTPQVAAGAALQTAAMPLMSMVNTIRANMPDITLDEANELAVSFNMDDDFSDAFSRVIGKGILDSYIEVFSEHTGGAFRYLKTGAGKGLGRATRRLRGRINPYTGKPLAALKHSVFLTWARRAKNNTASKWINDIYRRGAYDGVLEEVFEERLADFARGTTQFLPQDLELEQEYHWASVEQILGEALGFLIFPGTRMAMSFTGLPPGSRKPKAISEEQQIAELAAREILHRATGGRMLGQPTRQYGDPTETDYTHNLKLNEKDVNLPTDPTTIQSPGLGDVVSVPGTDILSIPDTAQLENLSTDQLRAEVTSLQSMLSQGINVSRYSLSSVERANYESILELFTEELESRDNQEPETTEIETREEAEGTAERPAAESLEAGTRTIERGEPQVEAVSFGELSARWDYKPAIIEGSELLEQMLQDYDESTDGFSGTEFGNNFLQALARNQDPEGVIRDFEDQTNELEIANIARSLLKDIDDATIAEQEQALQTQAREAQARQTAEEEGRDVLEPKAEARDARDLSNLSDEALHARLTQLSAKLSETDEQSTLEYIETLEEELGAIVDELNRRDAPFIDIHKEQVEEDYIDEEAGAAPKDRPALPQTAQNVEVPDQFRVERPKRQRRFRKLMHPFEIGKRKGERRLVRPSWLFNWEAKEAVQITVNAINEDQFIEGLPRVEVAKTITQHDAMAIALADALGVIAVPIEQSRKPHELAMITGWHRAMGGEVTDEYIRDALAEYTALQNEISGTPTPWFGQVYDGSPRIIHFIRGTGRRAAIRTIIHELIHHIEHTNPELYSRIRREIPDAIEEAKERFVQKIEKEKSDAYEEGYEDVYSDLTDYLEEVRNDPSHLLSEAVALVFEDNAFSSGIRSVLATKHVSIWQRLVDLIRRMIIRFRGTPEQRLLLEIFTEGKLAGRVSSYEATLKPLILEHFSQSRFLHAGRVLRNQSGRRLMMVRPLRRGIGLHEPQPLFGSSLVRHFNEKIKGKAFNNLNALKEQIKRLPVSEGELLWMNIDGLFYDYEHSGRKSITREELLRDLEARVIKIEEVALTEDEGLMSNMHLANQPFNWTVSEIDDPHSAYHIHKQTNEIISHRQLIDLRNEARFKARADAAAKAQQQRADALYEGNFDLLHMTDEEFDSWVQGMQNQAAQLAEAEVNEQYNAATRETFYHDSDWNLSYTVVHESKPTPEGEIERTTSYKVKQLYTPPHPPVRAPSPGAQAPLPQLTKTYDTLEEAMQDLEQQKLIAAAAHSSMASALSRATSIDPGATGRGRSLYGMWRYGPQTWSGQKGYASNAYMEYLFLFPLRNYVARGLRPQYYKNEHFRDYNNLLMHVRLDTIFDEHGNKILFVHEIQSDWHQAAQRVSREIASRVLFNKTFEKLTPKQRDKILSETSPEAGYLGTEAWEALKTKVDELQEKLNQLTSDHVQVPMQQAAALLIRARDEFQINLPTSVTGWVPLDVIAENWPAYSASTTWEERYSQTHALLTGLEHVLSYKNRAHLAEGRFQLGLSAEKMKAALTHSTQSMIKTANRMQSQIAQGQSALAKALPQAPLMKNWRQYGLQRLLLMAAEGEYDAISFANSNMQRSLWNSERPVYEIEALRNPENPEELIIAMSSFDDQTGEVQPWDARSYLLNDKRLMGLNTAERKYVGMGQQSRANRISAGRDLFFKIHEEHLGELLGDEMAAEINEKATSANSILVGAERVRIGRDRFRNVYDKLLVNELKKISQRIDHRATVEKTPLFYGREAWELQITPRDGGSLRVMEFSHKTLAKHVKRSLESQGHSVSIREAQANTPDASTALEEVPILFLTPKMTGSEIEKRRKSYWMVATPREGGADGAQRRTRKSRKLPRADITEKQLQRKLTSEFNKGRREGYSAGSRQATAKARERITLIRERAKVDLAERIADERRKAKAKAAEIQMLKSGLSEVVTRLIAPDQQRLFIRAIARVRTRSDFNNTLNRVERYLDEEYKKHRISELKDILKKISAQKNKKKGWLPEFDDAVNTLMEGIDIHRMRPETRFKLQFLKRYFDEYQDDPDVYLLPKVKADLARLDATVTLADMSTEAIESLTNALQAILKANDERQTERKESLAAQRLEDQTKLLSEISHMKTPPLTPYSGRATVDFSSTRPHIKFLWAPEGHMKPDLFAEYIFKPPKGMTEDEMLGWRIMYGNLRDAQSRWYAGHYGSMRWLEGVLEKHGIKPGSDELKSMSRALASSYGLIGAAINGIGFGRAAAKETRADIVKDEDGEFGLVLESGQRLRITKAERMTLMASFRDPDTLRWLLKPNVDTNGVPLRAPIVLPNMPKGAMIYLTNADVVKIVNSATPQEKAIVDEILTYMNTVLRQRLQEWSIKKYGYDITSDETHFPRKRQKYQQQLEGIDVAGWEIKQLANMGIALERTGGRDPIVISDIFLVFFNHAWQVHAIAEMESAMLRAKQAIAPGTAFHAQIHNTRGQPTIDYWYRMLNEVARTAVGGPRNQGLVTDWIGKQLDRFVKGALAANPKVMLYQLVSTLTAGAEMDARFVTATFAKTPIAVLVRMAEIDSEIDEWSPYLTHRRLSGAMGLVNDASETSNPEILGVRQKKETLMRGIAFFDMLAIRAIWQASKMQISSTFPELTGDDYMSAVAVLAERVVQRTQPVFDPLHLSGIAREAKQSVLLKSSIMFTSQRNQNANIYMRGVLRSVRDPTPANLYRQFINMKFAAVLAPALLASIMSWWDIAKAMLGLRDPDEEDETLGELLLGRYADVLLGNVYWIGGGLSTVIKSIIGLRSRDFPIEFMPVTKLIADFGNSANYFIKSFDPDHTGKQWEYHLEQMIFDLAHLAGVQLTPLIKDLRQMQKEFFPNLLGEEED